ncbi:MAG: hypothetical protein ACOC8X_09565 [Chloroflexota bacterium]
MEAFINALATIAGVFAFGGLVALAIERLVEKFATWPLKQLGWPKEIKAYVALLLGGLFSFGFNIDLFGPLAVAVGLSPLIPWAGKLLTALAVGGGSHFLHDIWPEQGQDQAGGGA